MARVYLAHHDGLNRPVAVKRLKPQLANVADARDRLLAEADLVRTVRHDHVVDVLDIVSDPDGDSYFVMEHLAGEPLSERIHRAGSLPMSELLTIGSQLAGALAAVHRRGIVHRDLKTENVLVSTDRSGRPFAKLIDFGVAEIVGARGTLPPPVTVVGTPEAMAPEQALGRPVDHRCDIYSFGVLLYEMVTGAPPFQGPDMVALLTRVIHELPVPPSVVTGSQRQHVPRALDELIMQCLAKDADARPQEMSEVCRRLDGIAAEYRAICAAIERAIDDPEDESPDATGSSPGRMFDLDEDPENQDGLHDAAPSLPPGGAASMMWLVERTHGAPLACQRLGHIAGAALFLAAIAAGLLGLMGYMAWSPVEADVLWIR